MLGRSWHQKEVLPESLDLSVFQIYRRGWPFGAASDLLPTDTTDKTRGSRYGYPVSVCTASLTRIFRVPGPHNFLVLGQLYNAQLNEEAQRI